MYHLTTDRNKGCLKIVESTTYKNIYSGKQSKTQKYILLECTKELNLYLLIKWIN